VPQAPPVSPDLQVQQDKQAQRDDPVLPDNLDQLDHKDSAGTLDHRALLVFLGHLVHLDHKALEAIEVKQDRLDLLDRLVNLVLVDLLVLEDNQDHQDNPDHLASLEIPDLKGNRDQGASQAWLVHRALQVHRDRDNEDSRVLLDRKVLEEKVVHLDPLDNVESQVLKDNREHKDRQVQLELQALLVHQVE